MGLRLVLREGLRVMLIGVAIGAGSEQRYGGTPLRNQGQRPIARPASGSSPGPTMGSPQTEDFVWPLHVATTKPMFNSG